MALAARAHEPLGAPLDDGERLAESEPDAEGDAPGERLPAPPGEPRGRRGSGRLRAAAKWRCANRSPQLHDAEAQLLGE